MRLIHFTLERDGEDLFVWSDLPGFYLWSQESERLLGSIVPLAQHLFWRNEQTCMVPSGNFCISDLVAYGNAEVAFRRCGGMRIPEIAISGEWHRAHDGTYVFLPTASDVTESRVIEKMIQDFQTPIPGPH